MNTNGLIKSCATGRFPGQRIRPGGNFSALAQNLYALLTPLGLQFQSPSGVELVLFGKEACVYSFRDQPARVQFGTEAVDLPAHGLVWLK